MHSYEIINHNMNKHPENLPSFLVVRDNLKDQTVRSGEADAVFSNLSSLDNAAKVNILTQLANYPEAVVIPRNFPSLDGYLAKVGNYLGRFTIQVNANEAIPLNGIRIWISTLGSGYTKQEQILEIRLPYSQVNYRLVAAIVANA